MNDIRRTILWLVFGFSMVMLWDNWQVYNGRPALFFPQASKAVATAPATDGKAPNPGVPSAAPAAATAAPVAQAAAPAAAPAAAHEIIEVSTDVLKLSFDSEGGSLVRTEFLNMAMLPTRHRTLSCSMTARTVSTRRSLA